MIPRGSWFMRKMAARKVMALTLAVGCLAGSLGSLSACAPAHPCTPEDEAPIEVEYTPLAPPPRPISPRPAETVNVVVTPPQFPFVEIALLEVSQYVTECSERSHVVAELRRVAGRRGCDVVIIYGGNDQTYSFHGVTSYVGYRATCGVFYASSPAATPHPAIAPP